MRHSPVSSDIITVRPTLLAEDDYPECEICGLAIRTRGRYRTCSADCAALYGYHGYTDRLTRREAVEEKHEWRTGRRRDLVDIFRAAGLT